jgi:glycosyltransferase involved in cell wall biosynthesis
MALRMRVPLPLRMQRPPEFDPKLIEWDGDCARLPDVSRDRIGVFAGNPNAEGRRFIYLLCDRRGRPIFLAKVGFEPKAIAKVREEQAFLQAHAARLRLPPVLGVYSAESALGIVLPFYRGVHPQWKQGKEGVGRILASWVEEGPAIPIGEIPAWHAIAAHQSASVIVEGVGKTLVQPVLGHGDLVPWNVLIESDGTWRVIDWERGQSKWVPGWDWFHYVIQPLILVKKAPAQQVMEAVAELFRSEAFRRYARKTGIEKIRWDLLRGYLIYALEVLKPTEGSEALRQLIEMTKTLEVRNQMSEAGHPSMTDVVAVMQTPPPAHGQAMMNQYLLEGSYRQIRLHHVQMAFSQEITEIGCFRWKKVTHLFSVLFRIIAARLRTKSSVLYYPPASPNMLPFLRDCVLLICTRWMFPKTVFHFHANGIAGLYVRLPRVLKFAFRVAYMRPDVAIVISEYGQADGVFLKAKEISLIPNGIPDQADKGLIGDGSRNLEAGGLELEVGGDGKAFDARYSIDGTLRPQSRTALPGSLRSSTAPAPAGLVLDATVPTILFVGMVCKEKGVGVLLDACRILRDRGVRFDCEVVGRASSAVEEKTFQDFIRDHDLSGLVTLTGPLHNEAKWKAYASADVFCFPTFYSAESFGLVAVEAMMSGLPVVSTNWSGLPDIVVEGETGFLVPPRDAGSVADRLELLIKDPELRQRMGGAGRKRYEKHYTVEAFREGMEDVLEGISHKQTKVSSPKTGQSDESASTGAFSRAQTISIITPSLNQLDWLRLCVASVADQVGTRCEGEKWESGKVGMAESKEEGRWKMEDGSVGGSINSRGDYETQSPHYNLRSPVPSPLAIEHIIQDGGTLGIEDFAREVGVELKMRYGGHYFLELEPFELLHFRTGSGYTLRVFKEPDAGMYEAINKGIARIGGNLWAWINSDEQYLPGTLTYVSNWFSRHPEADILCGDALLLDDDERALSYRRTVAPDWLHTRLVHLSNTSCASFYRRGVIDRGEIFDTAWRSIGDAEWVARLLKNGLRAKSCGKLLASYAFTGVNTSESPAAFAEGMRWMAQPDAPSTMWRLPVVLWHRGRKLLAGAYRKRTLTYALYEKGSRHRVTNTVKGLGWGWRSANALGKVIA